MKTQTSSGSIRFISSPFFINIRMIKIKDFIYVLYESPHQKAIVLEKRCKASKSSQILHSFPLSAFYEEQYSATISKCRQIVNDTNTIYVEKPAWLESGF